MGSFTPSISTVLISVSYAMLALQICDWFSSLPFEIRFIWSGKGCSLPKGLYFFSQYLSIIAQITNIFAMPRLFGDSLLSVKHCQLWYMLVVIVSELLLVSLEVVLVHRIYAMFGKNKPLLTCLSLLILSELFIVVTLPLKYLLRDDVVGSACEVNNHMPLIVLIIPAVQVANQCILFFLTLSKSGVRGVPILSLMIKDGAMLFMSCFVLMGAVAVQIALSSLKYVSPHAYHILPPIFVCIISILTCHLIRHMEESQNQLCLEDYAASFVLTSIAPSSIQNLNSNPPSTNCTTPTEPSFASSDSISRLTVP